MSKFPIAKKTLIAAMSFALAMASAIPAFADEKDPDTTSFYMTEVVIGYAMPDGTFDPWESYPAFHVNEGTVVTSIANIDPYDAYKDKGLENKAGYEQLGIPIAEYDSIKDGIVYKVYDGGEALCSASLLNSTSYTPFAVLTLDVRSGRQAYLAENDLVLEDEAYMANYGDFGTKIYIEADTAVESKIELKGHSASGYTSFTTSASADKKSGYPVLNKDGYIAGMAISQGSSWECVPVSALKEALDSLSVDYTVVTDQELIDMTYLDEAIAEAEAIDKDSYTEESYSSMEVILAAAKTLKGKETLTQKEIDKMRIDLIDAISSLEEDTSGYTRQVILISVIGCAILAAVILLVVFLILNRGKKKIKALEEEQKEKKKNSEEKENEGRLYEETYDYETDREAEEKPKPPVTEDNPQKAVEAEEIKAAKEVKEPEVKETQKTEGTKKPPVENAHKIVEREDGHLEEILTIDDVTHAESPTVMLAGKLGDAFIVRQTTGQKTSLVRPCNYIGRSMQSDVRIADNPHISRRHAVIIRTSMSYSITNLADNITKLNGEPIPKDGKKTLHDRDMIKLADEDFLFRFEAE